MMLLAMLIGLAPELHVFRGNPEHMADEVRRIDDAAFACGASIKIGYPEPGTKLPTGMAALSIALSDKIVVEQLVCFRRFVPADNAEQR